MAGMRRQANPDPLVETYLRQRDGMEFVIRAYRSGNYTVHRGELLVLQGGDPAAGFQHHVYPSNRRQAEALKTAQGRIEWMAEGE